MNVSISTMGEPKPVCGTTQLVCPSLATLPTRGRRWYGNSDPNLFLRVHVKLSGTNLRGMELILFSKASVKSPAD